MGFFVARGSTANYCQTPLSLSSSLNFEYLDDLGKEMSTDLTALRERIGRNNLAATLGPLGYTFVSFSTGFEPTDLTDAELYLSPYPQFTEFQRLLIDRTPLWPFLVHGRRSRSLRAVQGPNTLHPGSTGEDRRGSTAHVDLCPHRLSPPPLSLRRER